MCKKGKRVFHVKRNSEELFCFVTATMIQNRKLKCILDFFFPSQRDPMYKLLQKKSINHTWCVVEYFSHLEILVSDWNWFNIETSTNFYLSLMRRFFFSFPQIRFAEEREFIRIKSRLTHILDEFIISYLNWFIVIQSYTMCNFFFSRFLFLCFLIKYL